MLFGFGKKKLPILAPLSGEVIGIDKVDDPVFSQKILGDGFAVIPQSDSVIEVCAPVSGQLTTVFATGHAFAIVDPDGLEILVHVGIDTVELKGHGFSALASEGDMVAAGQPIVRVDAAQVREAGFQLTTPVVFTESRQISSLKVDHGYAKSGSQICLVVRN